MKGQEKVLKFDFTIENKENVAWKKLWRSCPFSWTWVLNSLLKKLTETKFLFKVRVG